MEYQDIKPIVVFGAGTFSRLITRYIQAFTNWDIESYCVEKQFIDREYINGIPVLTPDALLKQCPPSCFNAVIAIGYSRMGDVRKRAFELLKEHDYTVLNFVHPSAICYADSLGEGNIILENAVVSLGVSLGNANLVWNSCNLSHECIAGSFSTFGVGASFGGRCDIGNNCFFGINSTIKNDLSIADYTLVGAGAYLAHDTNHGEACIRRGGDPISEKTSKSFTGLFK